MGQSDEIPQLTDDELLKLQQLAQVQFWLNKQSEGKRAKGNNGRSIEAPADAPPGGDLVRLAPELCPYPWQKEATSRWLERGNGIVKVVTGGGKTMFALFAWAQLSKRHPGVVAAIVVPTVVLLEQWKAVIVESTNIAEDQIALIGGNRKDRIEPGTRVIISVLNSAATRLPSMVVEAGLGKNLLLIVDECHRAGAVERRRVFDTPRKYALGLSATPERDDALAEEEELDPDEDSTPTASGDEVLRDELGPVIYELDYARAIDLGVLSPFTVEHYGLPLNEAEKGKYERLSREITDLRRDLETRTRRGQALMRWCHSIGAKDPRAQRFLSLTSERKLFLYKVAARRTALIDLVNQALAENKKSKIIIFHESIQEVMAIFSDLRLLGYDVVAEHSNFSDSLRAHSIELFRKGIANIIVSAKSLVEGFNVPAADLGIVVAASSSVRQRIQTLGRLLRRSSPDKISRLVVLYAKGTVDEIIYEKADWESFIGKDRNNYFIWTPEGAFPVASAPRQPQQRDADIPADTLTAGAPYPGSLEGEQFTLDMAGALTDAQGAIVHPCPEFYNDLRRWLPGGGRFYLTPNRRYILRLEGSVEGGGQLTWLGIAPPQPFRPAESDLPEGPMVVGTAYPFDLTQAARFSVLQRDPRLIALKERGRVRFVVHPNKLEDPEKREGLQKMIAHLAKTYASGAMINKLYVTKDGNAVYVHNGQTYFAGKAPEGAAGFIFETAE